MILCEWKLIKTNLKFNKIMNVKQLNPEPYKKIWDTRKATINDFLKDKLVISTGNEIHFVSFEQIMYIKASSNYSLIYDTEGNSILSSKTLKYYEEILLNKGFLRVHSGTLINMSKVKGIKRNGMYMIILENDIKIPVSRSYKEALFSNLF